MYGKGYEPGQSTRIDDRECPPTPRARFPSYGDDRGHTGEVDQDEEHEAHRNERGKGWRPIGTLLLAYTLTELMLSLLTIVRVTRIDHSEGADYNLLGCKARDEAYPHLPVEAQGAY